MTKEEVMKLAKLSKLEFDESSLESINKSLDDIFEYMKQLDEVDTSNVEPLYNVLDTIDRVREDLPQNTLDKNDFLGNAKQKDEDFVILPRIV